MSQQIKNVQHFSVSLRGKCAITLCAFCSARRTSVFPIVRAIFSPSNYCAGKDIGSIEGWFKSRGSLAYAGTGLRYSPE
jgi:hypothetical protein